MRSKYLLWLSAIVAVAVIELGIAVNIDIRRPPTSTPDAAPSAVPPYDIRPLLRPTQRYLGVTVAGGPSVEQVARFADQIGKRPNLVTFFAGFDDQFAAAQVRQLYGYGALAMVRWEPFDVPMRDIAAGEWDEYITDFARAVRALNLPIALTFAHEMNGHWYSWGTNTTRPEDYVAAWRRVHSIFQAQDARNVVWTWTPNVINPVPNTPLAPLYPGDAYVDWIGIDGYYTIAGQKTFTDLFGPTVAAIRQFTGKPMVIVETGAEPGPQRPAQITDLLTSVASSPEFIGVAYFNIDGSGRWNIDNDPASLAAFRSAAADPGYGFSVPQVRR